MTDFAKMLGSDDRGDTAENLSPVAANLTICNDENARSRVFHFASVVADEGKEMDESDRAFLFGYYIFEGLEAAVNASRSARFQ